MSDLISRQEAIDVLNDGAELLRRVLDETYVVGDERTKYEWGISLIESYISEMDGLPSAQPERKKGKWHQRFYPKVEMMVCSECGNEFSYDAETGVRDYNFCPNCGADMRGEQNGKVR